MSIPLQSSSLQLFSLYVHICVYMEPSEIETGSEDSEEKGPRIRGVYGAKEKCPGLFAPAHPPVAERVQERRVQERRVQERRVQERRVQERRVQVKQ